ncbi:hypothetical protein HRbin16_00156 [bacterium HR16]|nr:hypothetical protein HRbin16_00156 [bacterium HR16]
MNEAIYRQKREAMYGAAKEFADRVRDLPFVDEVVLFGSLASDDPYPADIDLAVFLNDTDDVSTLAKYARKMSSVTHAWEVLVFSSQQKHLGHICYRKECPVHSRDCLVPGCGDISFVQVLRGYTFCPEVFLSSPYQVLWSRHQPSLFDAWRERMGITQQRSPEPLEPIMLTCIECGREFEFSVPQQKYFREMGFVPPKRCEDCLIARDERRLLEEGWL